jgi:4'-phosphopantetheinyl transferase
MRTPEVRLACARPGHWSAAQWHELDHLLDAGEREAAGRFRFDADRGAYVAAHAMLRALVARESGLAPEDIELKHDASGRPFVAQLPQLHVSLSRSGDAVACAVCPSTPVGIDIERIDGKPVDAGLLGAFVVTLEAVTARQFFFQWTALEAFWKARGTGLADGNPRIQCVPRDASRFDVRLENDAGTSAGRGAVVHAYEDCALAVVLRAPADPDFAIERTNCRSASDIEQLARAHAAHERFFAA